MASELAIRTEALTKQYGQQIVVDQLNLAIPTGQFYGLLGANGAGKSTTIHLLTTMNTPSAGQAWIMGEQVTANPVAIRAKVGLVFQDSALDRTMTIDENLHFTAALYQLSKPQASERIDELLSVFGLEKLRERKLLTLSGGQRRAVDIARGVLHRPKVLFLDEPTIGLDITNRRAIWRFIDKLRRQEGMTVFLTTHYLEEAQACDQVDFIQRGQLQQGGAPTQLITALGEHILDIETNEVEAVSLLLADSFGQPRVEGNQLSFKVNDDDVDFYQLQQTLGGAVQSMQWRKPNLNDVYLWTINSTSDNT